MDVFFEQIIPIKKTGKTVALFLGIWVLAALLSALVFVLLGSFSLIFIFGIGYGTYILSSKLNVEYEYIITNGILDIDKITNKSSRKRMISVDLGGVTRLEKFNDAVDKIEFVKPFSKVTEDNYYQNKYKLAGCTDNPLGTATAPYRKHCKLRHNCGFSSLLCLV